MIEDRIVMQMARTYGMNPDKARRLLEDARSEPAIVKLIRRYEQLVGGDTDGQDSAGTVCGAERRDQEPAGPKRPG